jgi:uncharacterized membrane protein
MTAELLVLRLVHILGGIFWLGSGLFTTLFLLPALANSGPAAGPVMANLQQRRLFTVLPAVALLTMLSGLRLMWITSGGFSRAYFASPVGHTLAVSGMAAIVAFIVGMLLARPAGVRAGVLGQRLATTTDEAARAALSAEMERMRRRAVIGGTISLALLVLSAAGMSVARYMG